MSDEPPLQQIESTPPPAEEGAPLWMATFGDMMSLLLVFFILLFSMSELKMDRFLLASQSLREAMGGTAVDTIADPMGLMPDPVDPDLLLQNPGMAEGASESTVDNGEAGGSKIGQMSIAEIIADEYMERILAQLQALVESNDLEEVVTVEGGTEGIRIVVQASALFAAGVAVVAPDDIWLVDSLSYITADIEIPVTVAGHADNVPIRSAAFASNWELSAVRAAGVARRFVDNGQDPSMVRVEAFGEHRPIATNDTPEGRAANRRVEFFYSRQAMIEAVDGLREGLGAGA